MNGLVSVIIPCYNSERYLRDTLKSVLWQTYSAWECILIDDGSTDSTASIAAEFTALDGRFRYIRQSNSGPSAARNHGVTAARGEFLQFLDADDIILPTRLALTVPQFSDPAVDVVYTDYMTFQSGQGYSRTLPGKMSGPDAVRSLMFENNRTFAMLIHSLIFRTEIIRQYPFDTSLHSHAEDVECWARMAVNGVRFRYVDEILSIYRYTMQSLGSNEVKLLTAKINVLEQYRNDPRCESYSAEFTDALTYHRQRLAIAFFMERQFSQGLSVLRNVWARSSSSARIKMTGWGLLLTVFSKKTVALSRAWIVKNTPLRWGAWKQITVWTPPEEVRRLLGD